MMENISLQVNGTCIERVNKVLGVMVDNLLTFKPHVKLVQKKVARSVSILWKVQKYLNQKSLMTLYTALVAPHLSYCSEIWGLTYKSITQPLFRLQKKALRIIHCCTQSAY